MEIAPEQFAAIELACCGPRAVRRSQSKQRDAVRQSFIGRCVPRVVGSMKAVRISAHRHTCGLSTSCIDRKAASRVAKAAWKPAENARFLFAHRPRIVVQMAAPFVPNRLRKYSTRRSPASEPCALSLHTHQA